MDKKNLALHTYVTTQSHPGHPITPGRPQSKGLSHAPPDTSLQPRDTLHPHTPSQTTTHNKAARSIRINNG